jgi:hypothetical protein
MMAKHYCFFFKEKTISQHQIYSTEIWGNALKLILVSVWGKVKQLEE